MCLQILYTAPETKKKKKKKKNPRQARLGRRHGDWRTPRRGLLRNAERRRVPDAEPRGRARRLLSSSFLFPGSSVAFISLSSSQGGGGKTKRRGPATGPRQTRVFALCGLLRRVPARVRASVLSLACRLPRPVFTGVCPANSGGGEERDPQTEPPPPPPHLLRTPSTLIRT